MLSILRKRNSVFKHRRYSTLETYYDVLKVPKNCNKDQIKQSYIELTKKHDKQFRKLVEAYDVLIKTETRKKYDQKLFLAMKEALRPQIKRSEVSKVEEIALKTKKEIENSIAKNCQPKIEIKKEPVKEFISKVKVVKLGEEIPKNDNSIYPEVNLFKPREYPENNTTQNFNLTLKNSNMNLEQLNKFFESASINLTYLLVLQALGLISAKLLYERCKHYKCFSEYFKMYKMQRRKVVYASNN